jgi:hypothetical protein
MARVAIAPPETQQNYLDALCDAWLGPIQRRATRSDKGTQRSPRGWYPVVLICEECGNERWASRIDARYCSNACRQRAYRSRRRDVSIP